MKNRSLVWIVALLLILGGGSVLVLMQSAEVPQPEPGKSVCMSTRGEVPERLAVEQCPAATPKTKVAAPAAKPEPQLDLQATIDLLNDSSAWAFPDSFMTIPSSIARTNHKFRRTKQGFVVDMPSKSAMTTPTYADGYLYTSGGFNSRRYYAINTRTGKARWSVNLGDDGPSSALLLDSTIIFNTESCTIFALDRFTGQQRWSKWIGDPLLTHPATDGKLVFTSYPALLHASQLRDRFSHLVPSHPFAAMDVRTGKLVWQRWLDGDIMTTPIVQGDELYLSTFSGSIYRLDKSNGKILAAAELQATSLPTIAGESIYITRRQKVNGTVGEAVVELDRKLLNVKRVLYAQEAPYLDFEIQSGSNWAKSCANMDAQNGFMLAPSSSGWTKSKDVVGLSRVSAMQNFVGSTLVKDGNMLYCTMGDVIICLDAKSGNQRWSHAVEGDLTREGGHLATMPIVAGDFIVSVTYDGLVLLLNKSDGTLKQSFDTHTPVRNQPLLVQGKVIVASTQGTLTCINTQLPEIHGWTTFLKNNAHNCSLN